MVKGSIHPEYFGIEAGLSATGDIFDAIARRAGSTVSALAEGLEKYRAGQTGLLRLTWDNGDRTVLVNAELGGVTLGWNLTSTAQDELFAAIEGTAFHTRVILERMAEHGVRIDRVINAGGIPQRGDTLNRVYANVLNKPVLVPDGDVTSLGSAIFAFLAAGTFQDDRGGAEGALPSVEDLRSRSGGSGGLRETVCDFPQAIFRVGRRRFSRRAAGPTGDCSRVDRSPPSRGDIRHRNGWNSQRS